MDPVTLWLIQQAGGVVFNLAQQYLSQRMGLSPSSSPTPATRALLDEYLQRLTNRLDEDRIAELYGALSLLRDAPRTVAKTDLFSNAITAFHKTVNLPEQGVTGGHSNAELRCMAYLGMAAAHIGLHDKPEVIAEKMVAAVYTEPVTARKWLGDDVVARILVAYPPRKSPSVASSTRPAIKAIVPSLQLHSVSIGSTAFNNVFKTVGSKCTLERYFYKNYSSVVSSVVFSLQDLKKPIIALNDTPAGSSIEAQYPWSFFNNPGLFLFEINEEGPSKIRVIGTLKLSQIYDWEKVSRR